MKTDTPAQESLTRDATDFLGTQPIFSLLMRMGIPAMVGMLVNALYNVVDTIFVGQGVGPLAIGALSILFPLQMIISSLAQAIGAGASSLLSRWLGEGRPRDAARVLGTAYSAVALINLLILVPLYVWMDPILGFFGATPAILPLAREYTVVVAIGFVFFSFSGAASALVRAEGKSTDAMVSMILGAVLNCVLDPLFIFGFGWGVTGAAVATVISQVASTVYLVAIYLRGKSALPIQRSDFLIQPSLLGQSLMLGIPSFIGSAGMSILALVINRQLGVIGGDPAITTYGMNNRLLSLIILPLIGIVMGFQPMVGYNLGARRFDRVRQTLVTTILTALGLSLAGYLPIMFFPEAVLGLFTQDAKTINASVEALRVMAMFIPLAAVQIVSTNYFQAVGKATHSAILGLSRQFIILIPLVLVLPLWLGLRGVWTAFAASDLIATTLTVIFLIGEVRHLHQRHQAHQATSEVPDGIDTALAPLPADA